MWFAIHRGDSCLKSGQTSLWVLRPQMRDFNGGTVDGCFIRPVFFPADQRTCERSTRQDGCAYMIRFERNGDDVRPLPMNYDLNYQERLKFVVIMLDLNYQTFVNLVLWNKMLTLYVSYIRMIQLKMKMILKLLVLKKYQKLSLLTL
mgnify:CR=1 FL=1